MILPKIFSKILQTSENKSSYEADRSHDLARGRWLIEKIYKAQQLVSDTSRNRLGFRELDKALEDELVLQLQLLNTDQLVDLLCASRSLKQLNLYQMELSKHEYDIRTRPFCLCKGVMKLPGPWDAKVCHALSRLWFENLKVLYVKSAPDGRSSYGGNTVLTEIGAFLRTVRARNREALSEGECLDVVRELECLLANADGEELAVRSRALILNLRELMGENPLEAYAYPISNTTNAVFDLRPDVEIHLNIVLRFVAEISMVLGEVRIAGQQLFGKGIDRQKVEIKIQKRLGLTQPLLDVYRQHRKDQCSQKGQDAFFPKGFPMQSFGILLPEGNQTPNLTVEEAASLWKQLDTLFYDVADFGCNAPPRPDLLYAGTEYGVKFSRQLMSAKGTTPTKKWISGADKLAKEIGSGAISRNLTKWLLLSDVGLIPDRVCMQRTMASHLLKSAKLLNWLLENGATMREAAIIASGDSSLMPLHFPERPTPKGSIKVHGSEPFILSETNTIIGKAAVWWLCRLKPNGVEETLARVCSCLGMRVFHHNNGKPGPVTRSLSVANACLSGLAEMNSEESRNSLRKLKDHALDPRLTKRLNSFL